MASRAAAPIGWLAYAIGRLLRGIVWFAPRAIPWALIVAGLLALAAWRSIDANHEIVDAQPRPEPTDLADVADGRATGWVGTSSIVRGPFLDSASYGAPVQRWYYLLLDPNDDSVAMIARSASRLEERRIRTVTARVGTDSAAVESVVAELGASGLRVDPDRYLVELPDVRPGTLTGDDVATPAGGDIGGPQVVLRGSFDSARPAPDGDGWEYLVTEDGRAVVVRSPHPPEALPVDVWGVTATDRLRTEQAAAVPELQAAADGRDIPDRRLLAEGATPPLPPVSYVPAMVLAALAAVVALGWLIGYPIFRREASPQAISTWAFAEGDEIRAELFGRDDRGGARVVVDGAPAAVAVLPADELERRSWQFALRRDGEPDRAPSSGGSPRGGGLAISSGEGPILLRLAPRPPDLRVSAGTLIRTRGTAAALRLVVGGLDLVAAFASRAERDRALAAIEPERLGSIRTDPLPPSRGAGRNRNEDPFPAPLRAAAVSLGAVGAVVTVGGAIGLPGAVQQRSELVPSLVQMVIGVAIAVVGWGAWLRRGWVEAVGFTVAWVSAAVAGFLVVAAPQCGLWLAPDLGACEAAGPVGSIAALLAAIALAYAAFAIRRHGSALVR